MPLQEAYAGTAFSVVVNVIDDTGAHATPDPTLTTKVIDSTGADTGWTQTSVTTLGTGIYQINWTGVTLVEGELYTVEVSGGLATVAWTPYGIPVLVRAAERGTDNASTFDATSDEVITDAASRTASQADLTTVTTELGKVPKKGVTHTYTNVLGGSDDVTITET